MPSIAWCDIKHPETERRYWKSIDMVRHRGPDGKEHYYSSKPPLFPTLLAGQYWVIRAVTGATLADDPFLVMRMMLVITNVLPLVLYFVVLWRLVDRWLDAGPATLFTHGGGHLGNVSDDVRRDDQQPSAWRPSPCCWRPR